MAKYQEKFHELLDILTSNTYPHTTLNLRGANLTTDDWLQLASALSTNTNVQRLLLTGNTPSRAAITALHTIVAPLQNRIHNITLREIEWEIDTLSEEDKPLVDKINTCLKNNERRLQERMLRLNETIQGSTACVGRLNEELARLNNIIKERDNFIKDLEVKHNMDVEHLHSLIKKLTYELDLAQHQSSFDSYKQEIEENLRQETCAESKTLPQQTDGLEKKRQELKKQIMLESKHEAEAIAHAGILAACDGLPANEEAGYFDALNKIHANAHKINASKEEKLVKLIKNELLQIIDNQRLLASEKPKLIRELASALQKFMLYNNRTISIFNSSNISFKTEEKIEIDASLKKAIDGAISVALSARMDIAKSSPELPSAATSHASFFSQSERLYPLPLQASAPPFEPSYYESDNDDDFPSYAVTVPSIHTR